MLGPGSRWRTWPLDKSQQPDRRRQSGCVSTGSPSSSPTAYAAATGLLSRVAPTEIFCANDVLVLGATDALLESGATNFTMMVGFDDIPSARRRV